MACLTLESGTFMRVNTQPMRLDFIFLLLCFILIAFSCKETQLFFAWTELEYPIDLPGYKIGWVLDMCVSGRGLCIVYYTDAGNDMR